MQTIAITPDTPRLRLLGRMDLTQNPLCLDWTGSGLEFRHRGSDAWVELEAPEKSPIFYMIVLSDGCPVVRFPVEPGVRFYPLILGMEADKERTITLMKETQCMPDSSAGTVKLHSLRFEGELLDLPSYDLRIEFIGDSLTSGEGALAPLGNEEWITPWFSARGNYSWYACQMLNAERRILSQSGYGTVWNYLHDEARNMAEGYEKIAGVMFGPEAEARGCQKPYDFSAWPADIVCIRLLSNDAGGMNHKQSFEQDHAPLVQGCLDLLEKIRANNPKAKIVWIKPDSGCHPEVADEAAELARQKGLQEIYTFALPDYHPEDCGARNHPNAAWNQMAGQLLGEYLKGIL
ncbi:MAG: hypothetical protein IJ188_09050 [Clostridia bacterium]|nr:hypothetical protein [Clostridia bacterium]